MHVYFRYFRTTFVIMIHIMDNISGNNLHYGIISCTDVRKYFRTFESTFVVVSEVIYLQCG